MTPGCREKGLYCGEAGHTLYECAVCGRAVCAACSIRTDVRERLKDTTVVVTKGPVCHRCAAEREWTVPNGRALLEKHLRSFGPAAQVPITITVREKKPHPSARSAAKKRREREVRHLRGGVTVKRSVANTPPRQEPKAEPLPYPADRMEKLP